MYNDPIIETSRFPPKKKTESNSTGHFASPGSFHPHPCHTRSARVFLSEYLGLFAKNSGVGRKANIFSNLNSDVVFFPGRSWFVTMLSLEGRKTDDNFGWLVVQLYQIWGLRATVLQAQGTYEILGFGAFHGKRMKKGIGTCVITVECKFK